MVLTGKKEVKMWDLKKEVDMTWQVSGEQGEERGQTRLPGLCLGNLVNGSTNRDIEYRLEIGLEKFFWGGLFSGEVQELTEDGDGSHVGLPYSW